MRKSELIPARILCTSNSTLRARILVLAQDVLASCRTGSAALAPSCRFRGPLRSPGPQAPFRVGQPLGSTSARQPVCWILHFRETWLMARSASAACLMSQAAFSGTPYGHYAMHMSPYARCVSQCCDGSETTHVLLNCRHAETRISGTSLHRPSLHGPTTRVERAEQGASLGRPHSSSLLSAEAGRVAKQHAAGDADSDGLHGRRHDDARRRGADCCLFAFCLVEISRFFLPGTSSSGLASRRTLLLLSGSARRAGHRQTARRQSKHAYTPKAHCVLPWLGHAHAYFRDAPGHRSWRCGRPDSSRLWCQDASLWHLRQLWAQAGVRTCVLQQKAARSVCARGVSRAPALCGFVLLLVIALPVLCFRVCRSGRADCAVSLSALISAEHKQQWATHRPQPTADVWLFRSVRRGIYTVHSPLSRSPLATLRARRARRGPVLCVHERSKVPCIE